MIFDINCDLGEMSGTPLAGNDELIMPFISSANIACGAHAGDPQTILSTVLLARRFNVSAGAHPGYPDHENFGRKSVIMDPLALRSSILFQVGAVKTIAEASGCLLKHVKPHGALYNDAAADPGLALIIAHAVRDTDITLTIYGPPSSELEKAARKSGLNFVAEFFADRAYNDDGSLVSRNLEGAVLKDNQEVINRVLLMIRERRVLTISGRSIVINAGTICIHGDTKEAPGFAQSLHTVLKREGIEVSSDY